MYFTKLNHRGFLRVTGEDRIAFLQGLVTNDVTKLTDGKAMYAALLTPQGKFLYDFLLIGFGETILIEAEKTHLPELLQRLNMYRLRSKVDIAIAGDMLVCAVWGEEKKLRVPTGIMIMQDPRISALGCRLFGSSSMIEGWQQQESLEIVDENAYDRMRLTLGVPEGVRDMIPEKSLLLEFGFGDLHGVDFSKGCYVGQEVTARTKYRATLRRFIYQVRTQHHELPPPGTPVMLDQMQVGEMRSSHGDIGLALLKIEFVKRAQSLDMPMHAGNCTFKATLPQWVIKEPIPLMAEE